MGRDAACALGVRVARRRLPVVDDRRANLTYPARGIGNLWGPRPEHADETALGALFGRSRAEILLALTVPRSTSELSVLLGQSPASVSQHLTVLRRSAMATSWRAGEEAAAVGPDAGDYVEAANADPTAAARADARSGADAGFTSQVGEAGDAAGTRPISNHRAQHHLGELNAVGAGDTLGRRPNGLGSAKAGSSPFAVSGHCRRGGRGCRRLGQLKG